MAPLISAVLPVHNGAPFLDTAVASIRGQTLPDFELLAIDDGSTDTSEEILAQHAAEDPRVIVHTLEHGGQPEAMNFALKCARGAYIARMDADDVSLSADVRQTLNAYCCIAHPAVMLRWRVLDRVGNYRAAFAPAEDRIVAGAAWP